MPSWRKHLCDVNAGRGCLGVRHDRSHPPRATPRAGSPDPALRPLDRRCGRRARSRPAPTFLMDRGSDRKFSCARIRDHRLRQDDDVGRPAARNLSAMAPTAPNSPSMSRPVFALNAGARLLTSPCAAPPLRMFRRSYASFHRRNQGIARDRQVAHAHAECIEHRIGNRRGDRAVRGFAGADRVDVGPLDQFDLARRAPR